jgi:hypothetical protein
MSMGKKQYNGNKPKKKNNIDPRLEPLTGQLVELADDSGAHQGTIVRGGNGTPEYYFARFSDPVGGRRRVFADRLQPDSVIVDANTVLLDGLLKYNPCNRTEEKTAKEYLGKLHL